VHGCALVQNEVANTASAVKILYFIEDVGRHNAVDAIAGRMWLDGVDGSDKVFYTTGRLTSEMVIKAAQMQIPFLVSRSGLTQMGYEIAAKVGITMIGRRRRQALSSLHREAPLQEARRADDGGVAAPWSRRSPDSSSRAARAAAWAGSTRACSPSAVDASWTTSTNACRPRSAA